MVGHIDDCRLICLCLVLNVDGIIIGQRHHHLAVQIAGEAFFTILGQISEFHFLGTNLFGIKNLILEAFRTTVQTMTVIITRQLILHTVQRETSLIDTVGITSYRSSEVRRNRQIILDRIEAQHYITHHSISIGHHHRYDTPTEVRHTNLHVIRIAKHIQIGLLAIYFFLEVALQQTGFGRFLTGSSTARQQQGTERPY